MAIHCNVANNMGGSTLSGSTITNTGMQVQDHMQVSQDILSVAGVIGDFSSVRVVQRGAGANRSVDVSPGIGYIPNVNYAINNITQNRFWRFINDTAFNVAINVNNAGNPRITSIFAQFLAGTTPDGTASNVVTFVAVDGTAAASPTAPAAPSDGNSYLRLADVTCANAFASIVTANISDQRSWSTVFPVGASEGQLFNGKISPTVSGGNLTLALLTKDGNTPSVTNPVGIVINGVLRLVTAALTVTKNAATNWCNLGASETATIEQDLFAYLGWDSTNLTVQIGFSRIPYANLFSDFSGTSTNEKYGAFGTNPGASDTVVVIGRFAATLSATAAFTWSVPTYTSINLIQRPMYKTRWLTWAPTYSGASSMTYTSVSTLRASYCIDYNNVTFSIDASGTTGGVASSSLVATIPFTSLNDGGITATGAMTQDTTVFAGMAFVSPNTNTINVRKYDSSNYALGATKVLRTSSLILKLI